MRSEGNVYNPVPERVPLVCDAAESHRMRSKATELACDIRLHRSFRLPPNPNVKRNRAIRVSYSDVGYSSPSSRDGERRQSVEVEVPVVLWAGGMFGGRYQAFANDDICKKYRVRFIAIDRPGIGGTDPVDLEQRVSTWLDVVPALLDHVGVKHVHLAAHSSGTIFILNTIMHQRHLLDPQRPVVAIFGPWVHPSKSGQLGLSAVGMLPELAIGTWHHWAKMVHSYVAPALRATGISVTKPSKALTSRISGPRVPEDSSLSGSSEAAWQKASEAVITNYIFAENVEGASHEALLCLRKGNTRWGDWGDTDEVILKIADRERARASSTDGMTQEKLKFQIYFAENDELIGKKGQRWLQACFTQSGVSDTLELESEVVPSTDHNGVLAVQSGAMEKMIQSLGQSSSASRVCITGATDGSRDLQASNTA